MRRFPNLPDRLTAEEIIHSPDTGSAWNYDLFEVADGDQLWRAVISGEEEAICAAKELVSKTKNEIRVMQLPERTVVAIINPTNLSLPKKQKSGELSLGFLHSL